MISASMTNMCVDTDITRRQVKYRPSWTSLAKGISLLHKSCHKSNLSLKICIGVQGN